jgi:cytochrome c
MTARKSFLWACLPAALLLAGAAGFGVAARAQAPAPADSAAADIPALLREKGCHACHAMREPLLGPPYQAIAALHGARRDVMADVLAEKIIAGGAGNWGFVPMIANDQVSVTEARQIAEWILDQAPR